MLSFTPLLSVQPAEGEPETHSILVVCPKRAVQLGLHRGPAGHTWPDAQLHRVPARGATRVPAGILSELSQLDQKPSQTGLGAGEEHRLKGFEARDELPATDAVLSAPGCGSRCGFYPGEADASFPPGLGSRGGLLQQLTNQAPQGPSAGLLGNQRSLLEGSQMWPGPLLCTLHLHTQP